MKLIESLSNTKFNILKEKPANVLKRIVMLISDFNSNRNGRVYSRDLWEKAIRSDYVKEMINTHSLLGELNHPMGEEEDRLEIDLTKVSHAINNIWIDDQGVWGEIDILPTPNGKIVNELIDYGTNIGISSRACGSVMPNGEVDPNDFQLFTWDIVARPSVANARFDQLMFESENIKSGEKKKIKSVINEYAESRKLEDDFFSKDDLRKAIVKESVDSLLEWEFKDNGDGSFSILPSNEEEEKELEEERNLYCDCEEPDPNPEYKPDGVEHLGVTKHGWICRKCGKFTQIG